MVLNFQMVGKKSEAEYFVTRENYMKFKFHKVLGGHSHAHSFTCYLWLLSQYNNRQMNLSSCISNHMAQEV